MRGRVRSPDVRDLAHDVELDQPGAPATAQSRTAALRIAAASILKRSDSLALYNPGCYFALQMKPQVCKHTGILRPYLGSTIVNTTTQMHHGRISVRECPHRSHCFSNGSSLSSAACTLRVSRTSAILRPRQAVKLTYCPLPAALLTSHLQRVVLP